MIKSIFKNRMVVGIVCIVLSLVVCFGITPLFNAGMRAQTDIVRVKADVERGDKITDAMVEVVSVGAHNLPADVVKSKDEVVGNYAKYDMVSGDYILSGKLSADPLTEFEYLAKLDGTKVAVSVTIPSFAAGLSGKLEAGDIISLMSVDSDTGVVKTPPELRYVEVLASTTSAGTDKVYMGTESKEDTENPEKDLPSSLTLLVNRKQAEVLAGLDSKKSIHAALVYRGSREQSEKFLAEQDKYFAGTNGADNNAK